MEQSPPPPRGEATLNSSTARPASFGGYWETPDLPEPFPLPLLLPVGGPEFLAALLPESQGAPEFDVSEPSPFRQVLSQEGSAQIQDRPYVNEEPMQCPITLADIQSGDTVAELPCGHQFSPEGLRTWLKEYDAKCPVCRYQLPSEEARAPAAAATMTPPPAPGPGAIDELPLSDLVRVLARTTLARRQQNAQERIMQSLFNLTEPD